MKKGWIYVIVLVMAVTLLNCSEKKWTKTFGGSEDDESSSVQETTDGGFIIVGITKSYGAGGGDVWLIKTDKNGNKLWEKTFGEKGDEWGSSVQETTDGGFIIVGSTDSYGAGGRDVWLIKTDKDGNKEWDKTFGGFADDDGNAVQMTRDGGYIIVGSTESYGAGESDVYLIKTDKNGNKLWDKTFGGSTFDDGYAVRMTTDGGYILTGQTASYGNGHYLFDVWLIKTDEEGNKQWDKTFGGSNLDGGSSVQQTTDGGYIIVGYTYSYGAGGIDVLLIKTDKNGNKLWDKTFGGSKNEEGESVQETTDGGFIIVGNTESYGAGEWDVYLIKTDKDGNKLWDKTFGGSNLDGGSSVQEITDVGYIIVGSTNSYGAGNDDVWLIKTDKDGNVK